MASRYDAILVPGGGLREGGTLPPYAERRFDLALARESGEPIVPLSAWTPHRPVILGPDGRMRFESTEGARYLIDRGFPAERIYCETTSYDTIGNAYFSRVQLAEPLGWRRLLVITSQFHMPRTEAIFRWVYGLDAAEPYTLDFAASDDEGLSEAALAARGAREAASLRQVMQHREKFTSMRALATWLFTRHKAYQSLREPLLPKAGDLMESY
jgi:hypothetical protein